MGSPYRVSDDVSSSGPSGPANGRLRGLREPGDGATEKPLEPAAAAALDGCCCCCWCDDGPGSMPGVEKKNGESCPPGDWGSGS